MIEILKRQKEEMTEEQSIQEKFAKFLSSYKTGELEKKIKMVARPF